ncbi:hypothetical protein, partial [Klebsiella pneumoniae]|uniref:hypothetical protein n=1 Tax=Klebsiella pneumoniae TaxID=573 RepID=UPI003EE248EA
VIDCSSKGLELLNNAGRDGTKDSGNKDDLYARLHFYNLRAAAQHALGRFDDALADYQAAIPLIKGNSSREL